MRFERDGWAGALLTCYLVVVSSVACSSSSTTSGGTGGNGTHTATNATGSGSTTGNSSGSTSSSASGGGGCTAPDGTYDQTITPASDNPASCANLLGGQVQVQNGSLGLVGTKETCQGNTITDVSTTTNGGTTAVETQTYTFTATGGTGSIAITTNPSDAGMCSYAVTFTKM